MLEVADGTARRTAPSATDRRLAGRGGPVTSQLNRREEVVPPSVRVPVTSPGPRWRTGGAPPEKGGSDPVTPLPPGRGRGPDRQGLMPPWAVLLPSTSMSIDARTHGTDDCLRRLVELPSGAWVSIIDDRPLSRLRLRR